MVTNGTAHLQDHTGEEPEETTDAMLALVVGGDTDVDVSHGGIGVTESNGGNVTESGFLNGLQANQTVDIFVLYIMKESMYSM